MALTGLQIFKLMPKTNCKDCGFPTCLAFSMALASSKTTLDTCPHVSDEAKNELGAASAPPVTKVTMGVGEKMREMGDEVVLFRHEKQFFHPTCLTISIDDNLDDDEFNNRLEKINDLVFERVGQVVSIDAIGLVYKSSDAENFAQKAKIIAEKGKFAPILICDDVEALTKALEVSSNERPLIHGINEDNWEEVAALAKEKNCPVTVVAENIDKISELTEKVSKITNNIVIGTNITKPVQKLANLTQIRRQAIRKKVRPLGYPSIVSVCGAKDLEQIAEASMYIGKYASIIILDIAEKANILPLLALIQNIFSDPQTPAQVEPGIYAVGDANENSPVYCTTNFSLTYYTVEGEVSGSKIPSWIIAVPTDGTSVLTAWAAGKYTGEKIAEFMNELDLDSKVKHKKIIIPGHVAVLAAPIKENSGWDVIVGPNEASAIPSFAMSLFEDE